MSVTRRIPVMSKSSVKCLQALVSAAIFLILVLLPVCLHAEEIVDYDFGYSLDVPEGYSVAEYTPDGMSYRFVHDRLPVSLILKLYTDGQFSESSAALSAVLDKLSAEYEIDSFLWRNVQSSVASLKMTLGDPSGYSGWAVCTEIPEKNVHLVLVCYAAQAKADDCQQFIVSTLNSLSIDRGSRYSPGIFTSYAFPSAGKKSLKLKIAGIDVYTEIGADDEAASEFVVACEYAVLTLYAGNEKWKEAWTRYYKCIFRDSYGRLKKTAFDIQAALMPSAKRKNKENPGAAMNEMLLGWVQSFPYERQNQSAKQSDFANLPSVLCGAGSDCDSRSMLMCVLLGNMGIKSNLFISREYSHAVYGADINQPGAKITVNGTDFLLGETTAKDIKPGLIAAEMNDTEKWMPVEFF